MFRDPKRSKEVLVSVGRGSREAHQAAVEAADQGSLPEWLQEDGTSIGIGFPSASFGFLRLP